MCSNYLYQQFKKINIELSEKQLERFNDYYKMLIDKNKVMNLTAITEYKDVVIKHFVDSVLILNTSYMNTKSFDNVSSLNVIDVGTGAGFPGIPLKIIYPDIHLTLLDSLNKRINFLNEVIERLELENISCIHGRAEEYGIDRQYREKYDICVSRAVANLSTLSEYCVPFIKVGGIFISYKSSDISEELENAKSAVKKLNCRIKDIVDVDLIDSENIKYERKFVIIGKEKKLSMQYPRKAGIPSKNPL